jgi:hypothetical protein
VVKLISSHMVHNLLLMMCLGSSSISSKGALGKCTSLFKFVECVIKERMGLGQSP